MNHKEIQPVIQRALSTKKDELRMSNAEMASKCQISTRTLRMLMRGWHPELKTAKQKTGFARSLTRVAHFCKADPEEWCKLYDLNSVKLEKETKSFKVRKLLEQTVSVADLEYLVVVAKGLSNSLTIRIMLDLIELRAKPLS